MDICFFIGIREEWDQLWRLIPRLLTFHPEADVLVRTDGTDNEMFKHWSLNSRIRFYEEDRLKLSKQGGAWVERMLFLYLSQSAATYLIKVDPDTQINRAVRSIPDQVSIFGCPNKRHLNGSCLGIERSAALRIWQSGLLTDPLYKTSPFSYRRYQPPYLKPGEVPSPDRISASDAILNHVAGRLGITSGAWGEACCYTFPQDLALALSGMSQAEVADRYALLHPFISLEN